MYSLLSLSKAHGLYFSYYMINRILLTISLFGLFAYQGYGQHKLVTEYIADSTIRSEGLIDENNLKQGSWTYYTSDGKVLQMGRFEDDTRIGVWLAYDDAGDIAMETYYENGISDGILRKYYPGRKKKEEGEIKDDIRIGYWKEYYQNGKVKLIGNYRNGLKVGNRETLRNIHLSVPQEV